MSEQSHPTPEGIISIIALYEIDGQRKTVAYDTPYHLIAALFELDNASEVQHAIGNALTPLVAAMITRRLKERKEGHGLPN